MQTYPIDVEPEQIVDWIMAESRVAPSEFRVSARRVIEARELPTRKEFRLGEEERDDLSEIAAVGTLQIAPTHAADGWLLTIVVEDELGPRILDKFGSSRRGAGDRPRHLLRFVHWPSAGKCERPLQRWRAQNSAKRLTRLLEDIEMDRHGSSRGGSSR